MSSTDSVNFTGYKVTYSFALGRSVSFLAPGATGPILNGGDADADADAEADA